MRKLHKIIGLTLLLPFLGWIITALVFYFKPGYSAAYETLQARFYPLSTVYTVKPDSSWREYRLCRTILGDHLLVKTAQGWNQIDPSTFEPRQQPSEEEIRTLVTDAFRNNPERYGAVVSVSDEMIETDTGIRISFDWNRLSFYQRGPDTDRIDFLYRIHYLQWTGIAAVDKVLGPLGLLLIVILSVLGVRLALQNRGNGGTIP